MKDFYFDYHNEYGRWNRWWVEADSFESATKKAEEFCRIGRCKMDGPVKEYESTGAAKAQNDALFEEHVRSFLGEEGDF